MPTKSPAQKHLMQAVEHNPAFAKKVGISQQVAREMLHPGGKKKNPANRMDIAMFKGADGEMAISHDAMLEAMKHIEKQGRKGDTQLVHVNKAEEEMLKVFGGAGTTNPKTGLKQYYNVAGSSSGQGAGEREGYSGGGFGGTAGAHSSGTNKDITGDIINKTISSGAGKVLAPGSKSTLGGDVAGGIVTAAGTAVGGPLGGLVGGLVGDLIGNAINDAINAPAQPGDPSYGHFVRSNEGGVGSSKLGSQGGKGGPDVKYALKNALAGKPKTTKPAAATTPPVEPTKDYIDLLLERFKFPFFQQPQPKTLNTSAHQALIDKILQQYQAS